MKCKKCGVNKLSKEFPPFTLTDVCSHPRHHCLRCVTSHWEAKNQCSQCDIPVPESCPNLRKCYFVLDKMFPKIEDNADDAAASESITVTRVNGESFDLPFRGSMKIETLRKKVNEFMKIHPDKQNLLYNGNKLKDYDETTALQNTLFNCGVKPNSTIHVMVLLFAVPSNLDKVVFDLYWGFPESGIDYLDACAWTFEGQRTDTLLRFFQKEKYQGALRHSGDRVDHTRREGHQFIELELHRIPNNITHIFLTLSSFRSRTISSFRNPSMKFYDANKPDVMLYEDKTNEAGHTQAIVMCSLQRINRKWRVFGQGALAEGKGYCNMGPIIEVIQGIIAKTGPYPHVPYQLHRYKPTDPEEKAAISARFSL